MAADTTTHVIQGIMAPVHVAAKAAINRPITDAPEDITIA